MKEKYITRTIKKATLTVKGMDTTGDDINITEKTVTVTGDHTDSEYLDIIKEQNPGFVPGKILEKVFSERLYRIRESVFLEHAEEVND